jgi:integrase/recombinase XerD
LFGQRVHLQGFLSSLAGQSLTASTRRRKLAAVRSFFRFLNETSGRAGDPAEELVPPERPEAQPRYLTTAECHRLRLAVQDTPLAAAMIELFLEAGMRLCDVAGLRMEDLILRRDSVSKARVGRGRHRRLVPLTRRVQEALRGYLRVRPAAADALVFQSKFRHGMGERSIQHLINKSLRAAGIQDASAHDLRHTYAVHRLRSGAELSEVAAVLGYTQDKTAAVYIDLARGGPPATAGARQTDNAL